MTTRRSICVVDDGADYRFILQQVFKHSFSAYTIEFFPGGQALLDGLSHQSLLPGLILLDYHMPGIDGYQTLLRLKAHPLYQLIPVVIMSAEASLAERQACRQAGANDFVSKPLDMNSLKTEIAALCQYWFEVYPNLR